MLGILGTVIGISFLGICLSKPTTLFTLIDAWFVFNVV